MLVIHRHPLPLMVLYVITIHLWWAGLLFFDTSALGATPVSALYEVFRSELLMIFALVSASILAIMALFTRLPWIVLLLMPQQCLLLISAAGAVAAIVTAQFADGVIRPRAFIAADQMPIALAAVGYAVAVVTSARTDE